MSKDNWGGNLVFFLLGAATGAAVALLYAPQEGEATRRLINEKASEYKDKAGDLTTNVSQQAKDKWGNVADTVTSKAQELLNRGQSQANDLIDQAADKAHQTVNSTS